MRTEHNSIAKSLLYLYFHLQKMYLHQNSKGAQVNLMSLAYQFLMRSVYQNIKRLKHVSRNECSGETTR